MILYIAKQNSDSTEGRGYMRPIGYFEGTPEGLEAAVEFVQGKGVMGVGPGEVWEAEMTQDPPKLEERKVYGHRQDSTGGWGYGYTDLRDDKFKEDPEFGEYRRLKRKFEGPRA